MEPITKLLKSKANNEDWNPALRGSLRSAIAGRQYPQARVFAAGWSVHNKCLLCLHQLAMAGSTSSRRTRIKGKTKPPHHVISDEVLVHGESPAQRQDRVRHKVEATAEQVAAAPVGNLGHRLWRCQSEWMTTLRKKWASPENVVVASQCNIEGHPAWERALVPRPTKPMTKTSKVDTFNWVVELEGGMLEGTAYSDGSFLDGPIAELARGDWAFVVLNDDGVLVASLIVRLDLHPPTQHT